MLAKFPPRLPANRRSLDEDAHSEDEDHTNPITGQPIPAGQTIDVRDHLPAKHVSEPDDSTLTGAVALIDQVLREGTICQINRGQRNIF